MVLIVLVCIFCYIVTTSLIFLYLKSGRKNIKFHFDKYVFFDKRLEKSDENIFARVLSDIISKKIFYNKPQNYNFINMQYFKSLYIQDAPVYILDFETIHKDLWSIYEIAISLLQRKVNLVIKNKSNVSTKKLGEYAFCYFLDENINYDKLAIFNSLNINYDYAKNMSLIMQSDNVIELKGIYNYAKNMLVYDSMKTTDKYNKIILPDETFGYKIQKNKKDVVLLDIFAQKKLVIKNINQIMINKNILLIDAKCSPIVSVCDSELLSKLKLIFEYKIIGKSNIFVLLNYLKNLAINHINKNLLTDLALLRNVDDNRFLKQIDKIGLKEFIQLSNLYKDYSTRYLFILQKIFGLKHIKNKIYCNPNTDYITDNFSLTFVNENVKSLQYFEHCNEAKQWYKE